jgi:hypothetical protein
MKKVEYGSSKRSFGSSEFHDSEISQVSLKIATQKTASNHGDQTMDTKTTNQKSISWAGQTGMLMRRSLKSASLVFALSPMSLLAQGSTSMTALKTGLNSALGVVMWIAFFMGVVAIINGGMSIWRGDTAQGKMSLIAGIIIAGATVIVGALFSVMNPSSSGAVLQATFN